MLHVLLVLHVSRAYDVLVQLHVLHMLLVLHVSQAHDVPA